MPISDQVRGALAGPLRARFGLGLPGAVLVSNPPPAKVALAQAGVAKVGGAAVTPFLLSALDRLSGGRTTVVNHALAASNAALAGQLAVALLHHH